MARQKNDGRGRLGGRAKGTPNKPTSSMRQIITDCWDSYIGTGQFEEDLQELDPATRIAIMEKFAQYIAPKMKTVDIDMQASVSQVTIEDRLRQLCQDAKK